ncbi:MAG: SufD family Fe-S cluster assembly protein [Alistipes sp.]|nr:SufD family Fe-S cluster assembly protein [Alistipes sp.]
MNELPTYFAEFLSGDGVREWRGGVIDGRCSGVLAVRDRKRLEVSVSAGASGELLILHTVPAESSVTVELGENATLSVTDLYLCGSFSEVEVRQSEGSRCDFTVADLSGSNVSYRAELNGRDAEWRFGGVFTGTGSDRCTMVLNTRHNVSDCRSESMVKGVVSGRAAGEFRGLVYVAPDAQRTDARQQSRNIELGTESHIVAKPQLEIYADDVKCSHGATVGHSDEEALFYMRQRGLSERDARRLQIEGFVKDVIMSCRNESLRAVLEAEIDKKLEKL